MMDLKIEIDKNADPAFRYRVRYVGGPQHEWSQGPRAATRAAAKEAFLAGAIARSEFEDYFFRHEDGTLGHLDRLHDGTYRYRLYQRDPIDQHIHIAFSVDLFSLLMHAGAIAADHGEHLPRKTLMKTTHSNRIEKGFKIRNDQKNAGDKQPFLIVKNVKILSRT